MSINFTSLNPAEHDNGAAIGSLSYSGAEQGSFEIYWDNQKQLYQITDDVLYLNEGWHFDTETSQYKSYTVNGNSISWSNWGIADLTVKFTPTGGGNNWGVVEASEFVFSDINETITLNSISADAFAYGAQVASVAADELDFSTVGTTASFLRVVDGALALESGSYYNPNSDRVIRPDNTYYDLSGGETTAGIVLYDESDKVAAYESITLTDTLFSSVSPANTPYYAGSSTATASHSSDLYIKSLLYENPVVWKTDAVNEQYQTDAEETVITYSFSGINGTAGDYTADYSLPDPNSDTIFPFADHHMAATRLALNEFENVANLKFVEIQETEDQVGTLRFAFTDAENLLDNGTQAGGWASAPWPNATGGDVWMHTAEAPDDTTWDRGSSYKFSTLLHEIGHTLGLNHPFEDPYIIPTGFDFTNYTLMSYTDPENVWWNPYWAESASYTLSSTPMVYDIAALQHLYGAASHNEADTEYLYDVGTPFAEAIWDTGGIDTLNFGEFGTDLKISLKEGSYSTIPFSVANPNDESITRDWSMDNNLGISFGAVIENATGGNGSDIIIGNSADNTLLGGAGDDLIFLSGGSDVVNGGSGTDILLIGSRAVSGYYSEIGEATPSFAIKPASDGSNEAYVYLKVGNHQTVTQNIETFEINGVAYDSDPSSNHYLGRDFLTYDPDEVISEEVTDDTSGANAEQDTDTETQSDNDNNTSDTTESETVEDEEESAVEVEQEPFSNVVDVNVATNSGTALSQALENLTELEIDSVSDEDYYKFVVNSDEQVDLSVKFSHSDGDLDANLYNSQGAWLTSATSATDDEIFSINEAGTYYLQVWGYNGAQAEYSLSASSVAGISADTYENDGNDTLATAYDLGTLDASNRTFIENLSIHTEGNDDYYEFAVASQADLSVIVNFDHSEGDIDIELLDEGGNWVRSSATTSNEETITVESLSPGDYYLRVYGYDDAVSSSYSIDASITIEENAHTPDAYEPNDISSGPYSLGSITSASNIVSNANIHSSTDTDYYSFALAADQNFGLEVLFDHGDGDLDIELHDSDGNKIDGSSSADDNEYISLSGLGAGTYTLHAYGYFEATISDYSIRFVEEEADNWLESYDSWWDWQEYEEAANIAPDDYEVDQNSNALDNVVDAYVYDIDTIWSIAEGSVSAEGLTLHEAGDEDWFNFTYDPDYRLDISIAFDGTSSDLDIDLYDVSYDWIDGSYGVEGREEISLVGLDAGEYYLHIYEYDEAAVADYSLNFDVSSATAIADLNDTYEPNNTFETATDLGEATGEGSISDLTLTSGDIDWFKGYFPNNGTPDQYVRAVFDHQDGDIDIELYDAANNLLRSADSVTDNETIYLSDIAGGSYYYLKVYQYGESSFQEYSIDYSFPVEVSTESISADALEGSSGNDGFDLASSVALVSQTNDLTIHSETDLDKFSFTTRNLSSSSSEISISYDEALGSMSLSLWAVDVGQSTPTIVTASASGTGREVINFDNYAAGTYYLQAFGSDGALIPDYSLSMNITEIEGSSSQSNVIAADQFDRASRNDTSETATALGTLSTTLNVADLSIHSETDKDFLSFGTTYAGETQVTLSFSHEVGDIDAYLRDSNGTALATSSSSSDNETLTFQSSVGETYTLEVYGYNGSTNRDYDLSIAPKQLNTRRDDYESNNTASQAVNVRDVRASFDNLTLHNASDQDWFKFTIADTAGISNAVQVTNLLGANADLKIYSADGSTQVGSTVSITDGSGSVDTSGFDAGDYYAVVSSTASSTAAASEQLSNYKLYVDQISGTASTDNASWTVMVYIDGDNNLASAAVDDLNEMEGVVLPENVNVVTLTDLSGDYQTSAGWTDARQGEISPDPNGYSWSGEGLVSDLASLGELNTGDPTTLTNFINWSTDNHAADNYALVLWDHGGGLSGIAWDDTNNHDHLDLSDIKSAVANSNAFSSENKLDLIGFDACLMQTYELGLEMASLANVMVASQELEPGDGWDYQAFLSKLAENPYASAATLGGYIVDTYDAWYNRASETLSSVDLTKFQAIDDAILAFDSAARSASGSEWLVMDDAAENAWSSARHSYGWAGEDRDLGQFFEYISQNASDNTLKTAAAAVATAVDAAVIDNSSRQGLSGIQVGLLKSNAAVWSGDGLIGKNGSAWGQFQQSYDFADRSVRSSSAENLTPDYSETTDALGRSSQGNNTSLTAFDLGTVTNATLVDNLTIHNAQDIDWYNFVTPSGLGSSGNSIKVNSTNTTPLKVTLYNGDRELIAQREGVENSFDLTASSNYFVKVETSTGREDIGYQLDVDLVAAEPTQEIIVADLAEGSSSNDVLAKATEITFNTESNTTLSNLGLSLTNGDQDWFEISAGRLSEQSPNLFSVIIDDTSLTDKEDVVIELANASGVVLTSSTAVGARETVIYEDYTSDVFISVKSGTGQVLDYKLDLRHADYDVDGNGSVSSASDGAAILSSLITDSSASEVAANLLEGDATSTLSEYMADLSGSLLDVDGDGVTSAATDGVILQAYLAGASTSDLLPLISATSPIETADDLLTHLLEIA